MPITLDDKTIDQPRRLRPGQPATSSTRTSSWCITCSRGEEGHGQVTAVLRGHGAGSVRVRAVPRAAGDRAGGGDGFAQGQGHGQLRRARDAQGAVRDVQVPGPDPGRRHVGSARVQGRERAEPVQELRVPHMELAMYCRRTREFRRRSPRWSASGACSRTGWRSGAAGSIYLAAGDSVKAWSSRRSPSACRAAREPTSTACHRLPQSRHRGRGNWRGHEPEPGGRLLRRVRRAVGLAGTGRLWRDAAQVEAHPDDRRNARLQRARPARPDAGRAAAGTSAPEI